MQQFGEPKRGLKPRDYMLDPGQPPPYRGRIVALSTGTRLGSYDIVELLGIGGMGEVYRARDSKLGRDIAIKTLPAEFTSDPDRLARFYPAVR